MRISEVPLDLGRKLIGTIFYLWEFPIASDMFSITPTEGYSSPGTTLIFEVTFYPFKLTKIYRKELICHLGNDSFIKLLLSGTCIELPPPKEVLYFRTNVRSSTKKTITIYHNTTFNTINIKPVVAGDHFRGAEDVQVLPESECKYEITYAPMTMSIENKHTGSAFFSFPDGNTVMYTFQGTADPPLAENKFTWNCMAKKTFIGIIPVKNWLQIPQKMNVTISRHDKETNAQLCRVQGLDHIDLPCNREREYEIKFYMFKEGTTKWKVTFKNELTGEFMFFNVMVITKGIDVGKVLHMETEVRKTLQKSIPFMNPLNKEVTIFLHSPLRCLKATPLNLPPKAEGEIIIEYAPLFKTYGDLHRIEFSSADLGKFPILCHLSASGPPPEPTIELTTHIGELDPINLQINLLLNERCTFTVYCAEVDVLVPKTVVLKKGIVSTIKCFYSPTVLGNFSTQIEAISKEAGRFWFPLVLHSLPPKAQGPYQFYPGVKKDIIFKNIFHSQLSFTCNVSNPSFVVNKKSFTMEKSQGIVINIHFKETSLAFEIGKQVPITAKMVITPNSNDPKYDYIQWVYYLKGII